jgi:transposase
LPATIGCKGLTARAALHCGSPIVGATAGAKLSRPFPEAGSPVGDEILQRIAGLYVIEKQIRGTSPEQRRAVRQQRAKPLVADLEAFIRVQRERLSPKSNMGQALAYLANHWEGLCVYLDDGRVEMDSNPVENLIRPLAMTDSYCTPFSSV